MAIAAEFAGATEWTMDAGDLCERARPLELIKSKPNKATAPTRIPATASGRAERSAVMLSRFIVISSLAVAVGGGKRSS